MKTDYTGHVKALLLCLDPHSLESTRVHEVSAGFEGLVGDKHAGLTHLSDSRTPFYTLGTVIRNHRQISIVSVEELDQIARDMGLPEVLPDWLGANLALEGIPELTLLPPMTRIFFPHGTVLSLTGENLPCKNPGRVIQEKHPDHPGLVEGFVKAAMHKRGLVAVVEKPGLLVDGDEVCFSVPGQYRYNLK